MTTRSIPMPSPPVGGIGMSIEERFIQRRSLAISSSIPRVALQTGDAVEGIIEFGVGRAEFHPPSKGSQRPQYSGRSGYERVNGLITLG